MAIHTTDWIWAGANLLLLVYPVLRLSDFWHVSGNRTVLWLLVVLGTYPTLLAVFHLTPFDLGLVYATTTFIAPLYFFAMTRYLGFQLPAYAATRWLIFGSAWVLALMAVSNVSHGWFAQFQVPVPGEANHMLDDAEPGPGMIAMHVTAAILVSMTVVIGCVQFFRARVHWPQFVVGVLLPALGLMSFASNERASIFEQYEVSGFILITTTALLVYNYALARRHFTDVRLITRSRMMALMPDAMALLSPNQRVIDCNTAFADLAGAPARSLIGDDLRKHLPTLDTALRESASPDAIELPGGELPRYFSVTGRRIDERSGGRGENLIVLRDVTEQTNAHQALTERERQLNAANERLKALSVTEDLTGLKNRRFIQERLEQEFERLRREGNRFGLLSIDLDHFKSVNDQYGHLVGDQALCHVSRAMESECRAMDTLARVGGEEFMVLLLDMDPNSLADAAERFRRVIEANPMTLAYGGQLTLTASIGGALTAPDDNIRSLLSRLDNALYTAKKGGRNMVEIN
ncbi:MAG: diguanylate cyclase [Pseudomonadaceae bacterium]|nr:diguanylate cyclase [Pseudomonadaceae bacterium]